jgi:hypothetical protein
VGTIGYSAPDEDADLPRNSKQIPEQYIRPDGAKDLKSGAFGVFPVAALRIDADLQGLIDPRAQRMPMSATQDPVISFRRVEGGFVIGLEECQGHKWETVAKPTVEGDLEWIPVTEFFWNYFPGSIPFME